MKNSVNLLLITAALIAGSNVGWAAAINSSTATFDLTTGGGLAPTGTANGSVSQFNPSLGTLAAVTLFVSADIVITADVSDLGTPNAGALYEFDEGVTMANLPGVSLFDTSIDSSFTLGCVVSMFGSCSTGDTVNDSGTIAGIPVPLSPIPNVNGYIGTSTVPFQVGNFTNINNLGDSAATGEFDSTEITGTVFLQYTYNAAAASTPEPGSVALIGGGLTLIGLALHRRAGRQAAQR